MKGHFALFGAVACASLLAACGGGSSGSFINAVPSSITANSAFSTSTTTPVSFGRISNFIDATITLPVANAAATTSLVYSSSLPSGVTGPTTAAVRRADTNQSSVQVLGAIALTVPTTITVAQSPAFAFTFATAPSSSVYVVYEDETAPAAGWAPLLGPGTASGSTITFSAQTLVPPLTFTANHTYLFALVSSSSAPATIGTTYSGTKSVNYTYGYDFAYPTPQPSATALPTTLNYTVTTNVTTGSSPYPGPTPSASLIDVHVAETDASSLASTAFSTDEWTALASNSSGFALSAYGMTQQEPGSATQPSTTTIYGTPQLIDQFPETSGASWSNSPAAAVNYSYGNGETGTRTINADGTYTDTENLLAQGAGGTSVITENSDGSGSVVAPFFGGLVTSYSVSAPSSGNVTFTESYSQAAQTQYSLPPTSSLTVPVFYTTPPSFYNETDTVTTGVALPQGCTGSSTATEVTRTIKTLDTVIGFEDTTVLSSYDVGGVPICLTTNDVLNYAYDFQGTTPYGFYLGSLGTEIVTTNQTLALQSAGSSALPAAAHRDAAAQAASASALAALESHELASLAAARSTIVHNFLKAATAHAKPSFMFVHGGIK